MDVKESVLELLGLKYSGIIDSKEYVDWAVKLMINGIESENIVILAGLDFSDTWEREEYFFKCLEDLNIEIPSEEDTFYSLSLIIARKVINNEMEPQEALYKMYNILLASQYDGKYMNFLTLSDAVLDLSYAENERYHSYFYPGMTNENVDQFIKEEFELYLKYQNIDVPEDFHKMHYCKKCNKRMIPSQKTKYQFRYPQRFIQLVCKNCKSNDLISCDSFEGRKLYLKEIGK